MALADEVLLGMASADEGAEAVREQRTRPGRIGTWRRSISLPRRCRSAPYSSGRLMPRTGPADPPAHAGDPDAELPDSYLSESEQQQAIVRERSRRFVRTRRPGAGA